MGSTSHPTIKSASSTAVQVSRWACLLTFMAAVVTTRAAEGTAQPSPPCVDKTMKVSGSGLEVVVTCPFEISQELLDSTFKQIETRQVGRILSAVIDHSSFPIFSPTLKIKLEPVVTETEVTRRWIHIGIREDQHETTDAKSACLNELHRIKAITVPEKLPASEYKLTRLVIEGVDLACAMCTTGDMADRKTVLELVTALRDGHYLMTHQNEPFIDDHLPTSLDGAVDPDALHLLPENMRGKALTHKPRKQDADTDPDALEVLTIDHTLYAGEKLSTGELESIQSIEFDAKSGTFEVWWSSDKYASKGISLVRIQGIWVRHPRPVSRVY